MPQTLERVVASESSLVNINSLRPALHSLLTSEQTDILERLDGFEAPYLEEKLLKEDKFKSKEEYNHAFNEFKKYIFLSATAKNDIGMISPEVDSVWHQYILFTAHYARFCQDMFGRFIHHVPETSYTKSSRDSGRNFIRAYQEVFGEVPEIWKGSSKKDIGAYADCSSSPSGCSPNCSADACRGSMCN